MRYNTEFMRRYRVVLTGEREASVQVAASERIGAPLRRLLESYHGRRVDVTAVNDRELTVLMQRAAIMGGGHRMAAVGNRRRIIETASLEEKAEGTTLLDGIINDAVLARASDVHLCAESQSTSLRYRVDGQLRPPERLHMSRTEAAMAIARGKVLAGAVAAERRRPLDGSFTATTVAGAVDVRLSTVPTMDGESMVLRLFHQRERELALDELGMSASLREAVVRATKMRGGMLTVCGPTGCGKTTTVYAMIRDLSGAGRKIITIEDPVEYVLPQTEQMQTNERLGLTFSLLLRHSLRQDPDVILIGEIRDEDTARLAVRAALTGHLVLATLHSATSQTAEQRLADLGVTRRSLNAVDPVFIEQRLVRLRCDCTLPTGCSVCGGTGWIGRTGVFSLTSAHAKFTLRSELEHHRALDRIDPGAFEDVACVG